MRKAQGITKWHVDDEGRVLVCDAKIQDCKYKNREDGNRHFENIDDAKSKSASLLKNSYGAVTTMRRSKLSERQKPETLKGTRGLQLDSISLLNTKFSALPKPMEGSNFEAFNDLVAA